MTRSEPRAAWRSIVPITALCLLFAVACKTDDAAGWAIVNVMVNEYSLHPSPYSEGKKLAEATATWACVGHPATGPDSDAFDAALRAASNRYGTRGSNWDVFATEAPMNQSSVTVATDFARNVANFSLSHGWRHFSAHALTDCSGKHVQAIVTNRAPD